MLGMMSPVKAWYPGTTVDWRICPGPRGCLCAAQWQALGKHVPGLLQRVPQSWYAGLWWRWISTWVPWTGVLKTITMPYTAKERAVSGDNVSITWQGKLSWFIYIKKNKIHQSESILFHVKWFLTKAGSGVTFRMLASSSGWKWGCTKKGRKTEGWKRVGEEN